MCLYRNSQKHSLPDLGLSSLLHVHIVLYTLGKAHLPFHECEICSSYFWHRSIHLVWVGISYFQVASFLFWFGLGGLCFLWFLVCLFWLYVFKASHTVWWHTTSKYLQIHKNRRTDSRPGSASLSHMLLHHPERWKFTDWALCTSHTKGYLL